jgi:Domain of unknown function (DUF4476)/Ricin-type beta-trefoil lectin domain/Mannan-binding protein
MPSLLPNRPVTRALLVAATACSFWPALGVAQPGRNDDDGLLLRSGTACLEVFEPQLRVNGARVQAGACSARAAQLWRAQGPRIVNVASGRCLELHAPDAGFPGARLQVADCRSDALQAWGRDRNQLVAQADSRCVALQPGDAGGVHSAECNGSPAQQWVAEAAVSRRDVEAGPLWNNADAAQKCPAVCAPQAWTGAWRTTVQGQMSVCACSGGGAGAAPPVAGRAMAAARFDALLGAMRAESFPSSQLGVLESAARDNRFTVEQLRRIVTGFTFPSDRVRAVEIVAPRVVDRGNAFLLEAALEWDMEKQQVRAIFEKLR